MEEATRLRVSLCAMGLETIIIADEQLQLNASSKTIRALEFSEQFLTGASRPGGEKVSVSWDDPVLLVVGRLFHSRAETEQKGKGDHRKVLGERELTSDEAVLDLYLRGDEPVWRITADRFDFSCLGPKKAMTAFANFATLVELLRQRAAKADFNDSYLQIRSALDTIWPREQQPSKTERRRTPTRALEATVTTSDNEAQFTRYSRLLRFLKSSQFENNR
jgi:hypothetical protein